MQIGIPRSEVMVYILYDHIDTSYSFPILNLSPKTPNKNGYRCNATDMLVSIILYSHTASHPSPMNPNMNSPSNHPAVNVADTLIILADPVGAGNLLPISDVYDPPPPA